MRDGLSTPAAAPIPAANTRGWSVMRSLIEHSGQAMRAGELSMVSGMKYHQPKGAKYLDKSVISELFTANVITTPMGKTREEREREFAAAYARARKRDERQLEQCDDGWFTIWELREQAKKVAVGESDVSDAFGEVYRREASEWVGNLDLAWMRRSLRDKVTTAVRQLQNLLLGADATRVGEGPEFGGKIEGVCDSILHFRAVETALGSMDGDMARRKQEKPDASLKRWLNTLGDRARSGDVLRALYDHLVAALGASVTDGKVSTIRGVDGIGYRPKQGRRVILLTSKVEGSDVVSAANGKADGR